MNLLNKYFDKIYVINLKSRTERMKTMDRRLKFFDIEYERVDAISGPALSGIHNKLKESYKFKNPNYLATNLTHLSIYSEALRLGYVNILILEDDLRIHRLMESLWKNSMENDPIIMNKNYDLLYLAFIPLNDDGTKWDYSKIPDSFVTNNLVSANNFWSLMAYGIQESMMKYLLERYSENIVKELDAYFVNEVQGKNVMSVYGYVPQIFAGDNVLSDNDNKMYFNMLERSVAREYARLDDYI